MHCGVGAVLASLRDRGELGGAGVGASGAAALEWSGRSTDTRAGRVAALADVYRSRAGGGGGGPPSAAAAGARPCAGCGADAARLESSVEAALTERDEFGRILTPKERFRRLCHAFHGIDPSKNRKEKRLRKLAEEVAARKAASGVGAGVGIGIGIGPDGEEGGGDPAAAAGGGGGAGGGGSMGPPPARRARHG